jgi:hypothetical protein
MEGSMADNTDRDRSSTPNPGAQPSSHRPKYRDNDDVREPTPPNQRSDTSPDSRFEARGEARENIGNNARGTDANPTGPAGNDKFKHPKTDDSEDFDADLKDRG